MVVLFVDAEFVGAVQLWDSIQGLCSYVRGMLSSQAILKGVGVGDTAATTSSAIFHFFLRDFSGMIGGVLFAMMNVSSSHSRSRAFKSPLASPFLPIQYWSMLQ